MQIITLVLAISFLQVWGANNPLHKDAWFYRWLELIEKSPLSRVAQKISFLLVVGSLCLFLALLILFLDSEGNGFRWVLLPVGVIVLSYSLGRGEFSEIVAEYTKACYVEDWPSSLERAEPLGVVTEDLQENDWSSLHQRVMEEAVYRGFERMFAVLFWFFAFGPLGALFYRLLFLFVQKRPDDAAAARLLWALEWPAVRLLGLSFCFTGNFGGGYTRWRETLFCMETPSKDVLNRMVRGALSVHEQVDLDCEVTRKELSLLHRLYSRSLWFWLGVLGLVILAA